MSNSNSVAKGTQYCAACGKADENLKQCSACKSVLYCGRSCQLTHRKDHKKECKRIEKALAASESPASGVAAMPTANSLRFLSDYYKFGKPMTSEQVKAFWSCFLENEEEIYRLARVPNGKGTDDIGEIIFP